MKPQQQHGLTPHLRFPEFQDAGEWEIKELGMLCKICTGKKDANEGAEDGQYPFFTCAENHIYSHTYSFDTEAILVAGNANVGQTKYYKGKFEVYQRTYVLTDFSGANVAYIYAFLNANLRNSLLAQVQTSAMSYIKLPMLQGYKLAIPSTLIEQQKIADCLASLDALIAAHTQKLAALRAYKQGLLQHLFPAEGETLPRLRFPEFRDDWRIAKIGDFVESYKGGAPLTPSDFLPYSDYEVIPKKAIGEGMWLKIDIEEPTYCKENFYKKHLQSVVDNTYLITTLRDLVPSGPSIGYIVKYASNKNYILAQGVYGLKPKKTIISDFLIHFSKTGKYRKMMQSVMVGSTQVHIRNSVYLNLPIDVPTLEEQRKIADCLTSLDDLIAAQTQKLAALAAHKKGLLQQLFPSPEEI